MVEKHIFPRVVGIFAHVDAGKTTVTEQLLALAGAIDAPGSVDKGTAKTDALEVERRRGISVRSSSVWFQWKDQDFYLVDTPGHQDFSGEVERVLPVLDGALLVLSAAEGVQPHTRVLWNALKAAKIPTVFFINKQDRMGADIPKVFSDIRSMLTPHAVPLQDFGKAGDFSFGWDSAPGSSAYQNLLAALAEKDEELLSSFVDEKPVPSSRLFQAAEHLARRAEIFPVAAGAALHGEGMEALMEILAQCVPPFVPLKKTGFSARAFKVEHTPSLGRGVLLRVLSGRLANRQEVSNPLRGAAEKVSMIRGIGVGKYRDIPALNEGELGLVFGLRQTRGGDMLGGASSSAPCGLLLEPFYTVAVETREPQEYPRLLEALEILQEEDPHLKLRVNRETRELHLNIFGYMQKQILQEFLERRFEVEALFKNPQTIYKETPRKAAEGYVEYTLPKPCWAVMRFHIEPLSPGSGVRYSSLVSTDSIAEKYQREVERTIPKALEQGLLGWEVTDAGITLVGGEDHEIHSRPSDFVLATSMGIMDGLNKGGTLLLEPLAAFEITVPGECGSRILGDLLQMRGEFDSPVIQGDLFEVRGTVPAEALLEYPVRLGALTRGAGRLVTRFGGYRPYSGEESPSRPRVGVHPLDTAKYILAHRGALG